MHRVDTATAVASLPSPQAQGTPGYFTKGDPATPIPATQPGPDWFNMIQEELVYLCLQAGITLDVTKMNYTQVYQAVLALRAAQTLGGLNDVTITSPANGQALVYNGSGWVNGTPTSAIDLMNKTLMLNGLRDAIAEGAGAQLVNSWPDPFVDTSGIDTGASSAYQHNATRDVIHNGGDVVTPSAAGEWTGATGSFTFSGDDISKTTPDKWIKTSDSFTGDFKFTFTATTIPANTSLGFYPIASDGSFNDSATTGGVAGLGSLSGMFTIFTGGSIRHANTEVATTTMSGGEVFEFERSGTTVTLKRDGVLVHTFAASSSAEVRIFLGSHASPLMDVDDISWTEVSTPTNMDLITAQRTPLAVPATGHLLAIVNNLGSLTYGTDLTMKLSRDDGDTWDTATIEELGTTTVTIDGTPTACDVLYIEPAFTGASETNLRARVQSFNNKSFELAGLIPAAS